MNADLHLTGPFGEQISVHTDGNILDALRQYGRQGYVSGEQVRGGITLPYDNERDFDWDLLGARPYTKPDGTVGVYCRGHFWTRREFEAVDSKKLSMPAAIRYSRGAKPTDPDHLKEKSDGEIEYVGLVTFKGGKRQEQWAKPGGQQARPQNRQLPAQQPAATVSESDTEPRMSDTQAAALIEHLRQTMPGTDLAGLSFRQVIERALGRKVEGDLTGLTVREGQDVARYMNTKAVAQ